MANKDTDINKGKQSTIITANKDKGELSINILEKIATLVKDVKNVKN